MFQPGDTVQSKKWRPVLDLGLHHRAQIGFILMSTDLASEQDFFDMAPPGVGVHITRLKTEDLTTRETLSRHVEHMADAASRLQPDMRPRRDQLWLHQRLYRERRARRVRPNRQRRTLGEADVYCDGCGGRPDRVGCQKAGRGGRPILMKSTPSRQSFWLKRALIFLISKGLTLRRG